MYIEISWGGGAHLKTHILTPLPEILTDSSLVWSPGICIINKLHK